MTDGAPLTALTIAGSDPSCGAGIGADLRTFTDLGVSPLMVITSVNAQNTGAFLRADPVSAASITAQLEAVFSDIRVDAVKIGMLATAEQASAVARFLRTLSKPPPIVIDPVLTTSSGTPLLDASGLAVLEEELLDLATILTPNVEEATRLARGQSLERWAASCSAVVLVTGGDTADDTVTDRLFHQGEHLFTSPRIDDGPGVRGTGCTLSSAIAATLARDPTLPNAVEQSIAYVRGRIVKAVPLGHHRRIMVSAR